LKVKVAAVLTTVSLFSGCAYNVQPAPVPVVNVQASYDTKIGGGWALVLDDSLSNVSRQVKPASFVCSAHSFPVVLGDALPSSLRRMFEQVFEQVQTRATPPSVDSLSREALKGTLLVRLEEFSPRITCQTGFFSGTCSASADIAVSVNARGPDGTLFATTASGSKVADGSSGGACEGGSQVLGDAINRSMKDMLERLGERVSNAPRLREAGNKK